jgi:hypothetical protein
LDAGSEDPEPAALSARMNDSVEPRRQFIETNAAHVKDLDI